MSSVKLQLHWLSLLAKEYKNVDVYNKLIFCKWTTIFALYKLVYV